MTIKKPDMVLDWYFDIPNRKLFCKIGENLEYIAHEGGTKGYTKRFKESDSNDWKETFVSYEDWFTIEKQWISDNYGETVGYLNCYPDLTLIHPEHGTEIGSLFGIGPDGRGLDHLHRMQIVMEGFDCAKIIFIENKGLFVTPDNGKTIYLRETYTDVGEKLEELQPNKVWSMHPQPCLMHPRSTGLKLSSYEEMRECGIHEDIISKCEKLEWESPRNPELQKYYIYPTK